MWIHSELLLLLHEGNFNTTWFCLCKLIHWNYDKILRWNVKVNIHAVWVNYNFLTPFTRSSPLDPVPFLNFAVSDPNMCEIAVKWRIDYHTHSFISRPIQFHGRWSSCKHRQQCLLIAVGLQSLSRWHDCEKEIFKVESEKENRTSKMAAPAWVTLPNIGTDWLVLKIKGWWCLERDDSFIKGMVVKVTPGLKIVTCTHRTVPVSGCACTTQSPLAADASSRGIALSATRVSRS